MSSNDEYREKAYLFCSLIDKTMGDLVNMRREALEQNIEPSELRLKIPKIMILGMQVEFHDGQVEVGSDE